MANPDNVIADPASGGAIFRTFSDGTNEWPVMVPAWTTGGGAGAWTLQQVTSSIGLPVDVLNTVGVTGTVSANQSGSWTVAINNFPATQPISISQTVTTSDLADGPVTPGTVALKSMLIGAQYNTTPPTMSNTQQAALQMDVSGNLKVNVAAGSSGNAAAGPTGSAVPADADYLGVNIGGTLRGQTGVNPSGSVFAAQTDIASVGGTSVALGQTTMSASFPITIASNQSTLSTSDLADGSVTGGTAGTKSMLGGGQYNSSPPTLTTGQQAALQLDSSGSLKVNVVTGGGGGGNAAAGATGSAVPTDADYQGVNIGGTLRGQTGVNPTGTVYAAQTDLTSVGGTVISLGQAAMAASIPVVIANNQSAVPVSQSGSWTVTANAGTGTFTTSDLADGPVTPGTVASKSILTGGQFNSVPPTVGNTQQVALQVDSSGNLKVNVAAGSSGNAAAGPTGSAVPADADYTGLNVGGTLRGRTGVNPTGTVYAAQTDISSVGGTTVALGQTTMSASFPVAIASNQSAIPVSQSGTWTVATNADAGVAAGTAPSKALLTAGVFNSSPPSLSTGQTVALQVDSAGKLLVDTGTVNTVPVAGTSGGATPYHYVPSGAANQDSTVVKASPGQVYAISGFNTNATPVFVKLYNTTSGPTSGSTPVQTLMMPGNSNGAGFVCNYSIGNAFSTGIAFRVTGGLADNDATAVSSGAVLNLSYD